MQRCASIAIVLVSSEGSDANYEHHHLPIHSGDYLISMTDTQGVIKILHMTHSKDGDKLLLKIIVLKQW